MTASAEDLRFFLHALTVRAAELLLFGRNAITGGISAFLGF
jgi:hypothetical protein